jgi:hypothetical protein
MLRYAERVCALQRDLQRRRSGGMKYWLIGVTAALSLMAMAPDYSVTQSARAATVMAK